MALIVRCCLQAQDFNLTGWVLPSMTPVGGVAAICPSPGEEPRWWWVARSRALCTPPVFSAWHRALRELTTTPGASPEGRAFAEPGFLQVMRQRAVTSMSCASSPWASGTGDEMVIVTPTSESGVYSVSLCYDFAL